MERKLALAASQTSGSSHTGRTAADAVHLTDLSFPNRDCFLNIAGSACITWPSEALSTSGFLSWLPIDDYLNRIFKIFPGDFNGTTALDL